MRPRDASVRNDGRGLGNGRDNRKALGGVVQREAENQQGAQRRFAKREGCANRQTLAEVVQADAHGYEKREHAARCRRSASSDLDAAL